MQFNAKLQFVLTRKPNTKHVRTYNLKQQKQHKFVYANHSTNATESTMVNRVYRIISYYIYT